MNSELIHILAANGIIPVLLTQAVLQRAGVRRIYPLAITMVVLALAEIIDVLVTAPDFNTLWTHFSATESIAQCGGNPSPRTYCASRLWRSDTLYGSLFLSIHRLGYLAAPLFVIDLVINGPARPLWMNRMRELLERKLEALQVLVCLIHSCMWFFLQVVLVSGMAIYFVVVVAIFQTMSVDSSLWTYAQVVAVFIWAPLVTKYLYFSIGEYKILCRWLGEGSVAPSGMDQRAETRCSWRRQRPEAHGVPRADGLRRFKV
ncbi:hypothetical protein GQ53DRAFT_127800 [Thozetella sp. PMI_491]|nr:hypothetical protein GQ53DRAFT_127800 [Thozetella sp. PMI_491]